VAVVRTDRLQDVDLIRTVSASDYTVTADWEQLTAQPRSLDRATDRVRESHGAIGGVSDGHLLACLDFYAEQELKVRCWHVGFLSGVSEVRVGKAAAAGSRNHRRRILILDTEMPHYG
jgi:hypothetical protein